MYSNRSVLQQMDVSESYRVFQQVLDEKKSYFLAKLEFSVKLKGDLRFIARM